MKSIFSKIYLSKPFKRLLLKYNNMQLRNRDISSSTTKKSTRPCAKFSKSSVVHTINLRNRDVYASVKTPVKTSVRAASRSTKEVATPVRRMQLRNRVVTFYDAPRVTFTKQLVESDESEEDEPVTGTSYGLISSICRRLSF